MEIELFRIGTRKSQLARTQAEMVRAALSAVDCPCELVEIDSHGDADLTTPLYDMDPLYPGVFTKHLEMALRVGEVDLAVHSLKDLPTRLPDGLVLRAVSPRETPTDRLLIRADRHRPDEPLGLPTGATVGTSSLRREAQLLCARPDLIIQPLRGNVPTRMDAARKGTVDAVVLAAAGLQRLRLPTDGLVVVELDPVQFVGAPAQGVVAVETRDKVDPRLSEALKRFHNAGAFREASIERAILRGLDGGCTLPLGVRCEAKATGPAKVHAFLGVAKDREAGKREWLGFKHFAAEGTDDDKLVAEVVKGLKEGDL